MLEVFRETEDDAEAMVDEYMEMYKSLDRDGDLGRQITALEQKITTVEKKKQKLLTYNALGELSDKDFLSMNRQCAKELDEAQQELMELTQQRDSASDYKKQIETIRRVLKNAERDAVKGLIDKEFVEKYIDKIFVTPSADGSMSLQIKIFTGKTTEKVLQNLRSRTGHTFKKMIESYEKSL